MPNLGYSAPFFRIYYQDQELLPGQVTKLNYVYSEEDDDEITIKFDLLKPEDVDQPWFQPKAELVVQWGFINGDTVKRKVYVENPVISYGKDGIKLTLSCAEKGIILKGSTDNKIYKNKTLPEVVKDKAEKHGLKGFIEFDDTEIDSKIVPIPGETLSQYFIRSRKEQVEKDVAKRDEEYRRNPAKHRMDVQKFIEMANKANEADSAGREERRIRAKYQEAWDAGVPIDVDAATKREIGFNKLINSFKNYTNQPQANRSDKQLLDSMGRREPNGPYFVETRDDEITLKKRVFTKIPVASFEYGGSEGTLIEFNSEKKNKRRKGSAVGMGFSGYNPMDKTFFSGTATPADGDPSLAKAIDMLAFYKKVQTSGGGKLVTGTRLGKTILPFINDHNVAAKIDNIGIYTRTTQSSEITVDDQVSALDKAINEFNAKKDARRKEMYNALGINPPEAYESAANLRRNGELKKNPATATVWGMPTLETGQIVTILGVGKKHSGNYYVRKAEHEVDKSGGYITSLELTRQGDNIKVNEDYADAKDMGRPVNNKLPNKLPVKKAVVEVKTNPEPPQFKIFSEGDK